MILLKALVPGHDRHQASGKVVHVNAYNTRAPAAAVTPPVISYSSGGTAPAHLRGYILANSPVGVSLSEFGPGTPSWDMVIGYAQRGGQVFVDSGAFPAFTRGQAVDWPTWRRKVARLVYDVLGGENGTTTTLEGPRLHIVMPDVIGDQAASLTMLGEQRDFVRSVIDAGQDALVAIQKGPLSPHDAWRTAVGLLGTSDFTVCVPSNKVAFSLEDLANLMGGPEKPARVHFLGVAGNLRKLAELAAVVHRANPAAVVTSDANRLRAKVGEGRVLTEKRRSAEAALRSAFSRLVDEVHPHLKEAWEQHQDSIIGATPTTVAIFEDERESRAQPDLFGGVPLRKAIVLLRA